MEKTHKIDVVSIRLVEEPPLYSSKELKNPCDVAELFQDFLKDCDREMFCILNLRTKNQVINVNVVGMGQSDWQKPAILWGLRCWIISWWLRTGILVSGKKTYYQNTFKWKK